jgi:OOP family OmpA-OmpF porin
MGVSFEVVAGGAGNRVLSDHRATAVKDALTARYGVAASRLTAGGAGDSQPLETNSTLEGRARNRRVELTRD